MNEFVVEMCDPRTRESEIKELFNRNGKADFASVFERAYRTRADAGLRSWVGMLNGRAVMHISVTPVPFVNRDRSMVVGILGDLMVDESHRDFWTPVRLLRQMTADLRSASTADYLISTTVAEAESVFKAAGFKPFGSLQRYVLPTFSPYLLYAGLRNRTRHVRWEEAGSGLPLGVSMVRGENWRPEPTEGYYATRIPRSDFADGTWIRVSRKGGTTAGHALLSRNEEAATEAGVADAFWSAGDLHEIVLASGRWAAQSGMRKLVITTLQDSDTARALVAAGFFPRDVCSLLLLHKLKREPPPPASEWFLPWFAFNSW